MAEPLNGLRFDIYERVQLPEEAASIEELEEIELLPNMQAVTLEDQIVLKGHLLLSGLYRSQESDSTGERLEYRIPVEISLPPARVPRVEDLRVSIDHFDVDLLSARSLNVTGVLALQGLQSEPQQPPVWRDDSFTVVHQAQPAETWDREQDEGQAEVQRFGDEESSSPDALDRQLSNEKWGDISAELKGQPSDASLEQVRSAAAGEPEEAVSDELREETKAIGQDESEDGQAALSADISADQQEEEQSFRTADSQDAQEATAEATQQDERNADADERADTAFPAFQAEAGAPGFTAAPYEPAEVQARQDEENREPQPAEIYAEKQELKVAMGSKSASAASADAAGVGLLSALAEKSESRQSELRGSSSAQAEADGSVAKTAGTGDEVEWTKLFLSKSSGEEQFRKVRMYIVQRDDTLESVAARYNIQVRDLQIRNKLSDTYLSEGQVLYIP